MFCKHAEKVVPSYLNEIEKVKITKMEKILKSKTVKVESLLTFWSPECLFVKVM